MYAQDVEEAVRDTHAGHLDGLALARDVHRKAVNTGDLLEALIACAPIQEVLRLDDVRATAGLAFPYHRDSIRVAERQGAQQDGVDHAEDRGGRSDAEREHADGGDREPG